MTKNKFNSEMLKTKMEEIELKQDLESDALIDYIKASGESLDFENSNVSERKIKECIKDTIFYLKKYIEISKRLRKFKITSRENNIISEKESESIIEYLKQADSVLVNINDEIEDMKSCIDRINNDLTKTRNFSTDDYYKIIDLSSNIRSFCAICMSVIPKMENPVKFQQKDLSESVKRELLTFINKHESLAKKLIDIHETSISVIPAHVWRDMGLVFPPITKAAAHNLYTLGVLADKYIIDYEKIRIKDGGLI